MKNTTTLKNLAKYSAVVATLAFVGCAKEKPFDEQYKAVELLSRSNIVTEETVTLENGQKVTRPVEYIYVPMTLGTPMNVTDADPFFQGDEKLVRLAWSEQGLEVREIEDDRRFADNDLNEYPVLTIPGDYKSYRCREDAYGECTNVEEENTELEWYDKTSFLPKLEDIKEREVNTLDIFTLNNGSCLSEGDTNIVNYEIKPGVINVELEKNYKVSSTNFWCFFRSYFSGNLSINGFRVRQFYSLVRRDMLATPGYKKVEYPDRDHSTFGFFAREEEVLTDSFDRQRKEKKILMERWLPGTPMQYAKDEKGEIIVENGKKKVIPYQPRIIKYHLTPEFSKPKNDYILKATYEAIDTMNKEMRAENVPLQLELVEQPDPKKAVSPGDLRYTSLVLIEDPLANGLLGYGPAVSDPYTGEIVKAHTNMYLGVLKSMTRRTYQAAVDLTEERYREANPAQEATEEIKVSPEALSNLPEALALAHFPELVEANLPALPTPTPAPTPADDNDDDAQGDGDQGDVAGNDDDQGENNDDQGETPVVVEEENQPALGVDNRRSLDRLAHAGHNHGALKRHKKFSKAEMERILSKVSVKDLLNKEKSRRLLQNDTSKAAVVLQQLKDEGKLTKQQEILYKEMARLDRYAENNALAVEFFPIGGTSKVVYPELLAVPEIQTERGTLKPFDELTDEQKEQVQKIVTASSYKATLVHELGHNLGLRHNFMGSWDKDNFLSDEEAQTLGMEAAPAYSSVMDYSFSEFNQLKALGTYDLAALRFGYTSEIEKAGERPNFFAMDEEEAKKARQKYMLENFTKVEGSIYDFLEDKNDQFREYAFCTDENAGLSTSCNRFDEGTNLVEVTQHLIKRYKDAYKYRNFRDGRLDYNTYDFPTYILWRQWEFGKIRDVMEDFEVFTQFFDKDFMEQGCSPQQTAQFPVCQMINDRRDAVKLVGEFFLEMLITPDHLCALAKPEEPNVIVEYRKLYDIYEDLRFDLDYVPHSCFDAAVVKKVGEDNEQTEENDARVVIGEAGKFFNGFKDNNPNFRYAQDRYAYGIWPDKILAFEALFDRTWNKGNTDDGHLALVDISFVREQVNPMLDHMILGKPIPQTVPFTMADGKQFKVPYAIASDYKINPLEKVFWWLKSFLGLPTGEAAKGNLLTSSLHMLKIDVDYGDDYEQQAFEMRNLTAVTQIDGWIPEGDRNPKEEYWYDEMNRMTFVADSYTPYAMTILKTLNNFDTLKAIGRATALKVSNQRTNPEPPQTLPVPVQVFWSVDAELQQTLINAAVNGGEFTVDQFKQFFGEQLGPLLHAVYMQGPDFMKAIVEMREQVRNTPPADATDDEKKLYELPEQIVTDYAKGLINEEVLKLYIENLRNLPYRMRISTNDVGWKL